MENEKFNRTSVTKDFINNLMSKKASNNTNCELLHIKWETKEHKNE